MSCFKTIISSFFLPLLFSMFNFKIKKGKKGENKVYPTAIIRAKKNDQVVAIPPNK